MADKNLTIKKATDKELNEILMRLRKEREVLSLVGDMKRMTRTQDEVSIANMNGYGYDILDVSTEKPVDTMYHSDEELNAFLHALIKSGDKDALEHAGILGMHWGKRKAAKIAATQSRTSALSRVQADATFSLLKQQHGKSLAKKIVRNLEKHELRSLNSAVRIEKAKRFLKRGALATATILGAGAVLLA